MASSTHRRRTARWRPSGRARVHILISTEAGGEGRNFQFCHNLVNLDEHLDFLAVGHEIVDALLARARCRAYGGRASVRRVKTDESEPTSGWFFTFVLEFQGVHRTKAVYPAFIAMGGPSDPLLADWLLDRAMRIKRRLGRTEPATAAGCLRWRRHASE